ncbi:platelet endothelial aggregation receptor 1-like isoform X2 [Saccostrea cucullata]|uniref:platelet endothelial aggregation receptor 1-like isoform X2 n=1 Tax=Saccostrea cuccullata TaxID=36930 RepID=UPI002ED5821E
MAIFLLLLLKQLAHTSGYDHLSFNKTTEHSQNYNNCYLAKYCDIYHSRNAVDRNNDTCTRTRPIEPSNWSNQTWWYVDLGGIYNVYKVNIIFRLYEPRRELSQRGRFAGFSLYLSNSTNIDEGLLCYKDGPDLPPLDINVTCSGHARYVFYYNERLPGVKYPEGYQMLSYTELCEVIVLGCRSGVYGENCNLQCSENCFGEMCDIVNGTCYSCKPGWKENFCGQECTSGTYGVDCKYQCSGHCLNGLPCNHVTGKCPDKCAAGWTGNFCGKQCAQGKYGPNCVLNCSGHCKDNVPCNKETGRCDTGCNTGYIGRFCSEACDFGRFGDKCTNICSGHCLYNETCNHVNGICSKGCAPGYFGSFCSKVCLDGSYGLNCSGICSPNCIGTCGKSDGSCKCVPGFTNSPNCSKECPPGFYGVNCKYRCSGKCVHEETCSRYDGSCSLGCKDNYVGLACDFLRDSQTSSPTLGLAIVVAVLSLCLIAAFIFFCLRPHQSITQKDRKPRYETKDNVKVGQSSTQPTNYTDEDTHIYQDLDEKDAYELMKASELYAYKNIQYSAYN